MVERRFSRRFPKTMVLPTALLLLACGSSTNKNKTLPGLDGSSGLDSGPILDDLFTSPDVPRCENTFTAQYQLKGSIEGDEVSAGDGFISYLDSTSLSFGAVRFTWADPLAEDKAIPLTGATLAIPAGHPLEGHGLCITQGKFGSPTLHQVKAPTIPTSPARSTRSAGMRASSPTPKSLVSPPAVRRRMHRLARR